MVCTDVLHLHSRKLTSYKGDFDTFERTATERLKNAKKAAEGQERQRAHMQVWGTAYLKPKPFTKSLCDTMRRCSEADPGKKAWIMRLVSVNQEGC